MNNLKYKKQILFIFIYINVHTQDALISLAIFLFCCLFKKKIFVKVSFKLYYQQNELLPVGKLTKCLNCCSVSVQRY